MLEYERKGYVSVWLGCFPNTSTCEEYLTETYNEDGDASSHFWSDLGVGWLDHDLQEAHYEESGPVPVEQFFRRGLSYLDSFREPLLEACRKRGIQSAGAVIFVFDLVYPEQQPFPSPYLKFVGAFAYGVEDRE